MSDDKKDQKDDRDDVDRVSPQKVFDQGETVQVGGTVINASLNRDENKVEGHKEEDHDGHNYNEADPNNENFDAEKSGLSDEAIAAKQDDHDDDDDDRSAATARKRDRS